MFDEYSIQIQLVMVLPRRHMWSQQDLIALFLVYRSLLEYLVFK